MREEVGFLRRSWRHHPVLSAVLLAFVLAGSVAGIARLTSPGRGPADGVWLLCLAGTFVCWVLLIRRDES